MNIEAKLLEWQAQKGGAVYVSRFNLYSQSGKAKFGLDVEFHVIDKYDPEWPDEPKKSFFGTLPEIISQVDAFIQAERNRLKQLIEE